MIDRPSPEPPYIRAIDPSTCSNDLKISSSLFCGINQLTNGIRFAVDNGWDKNLAIIVNNLGFAEIGFSKEYSDKPPSGQYGIFFRRDILKIDGVDLILDCETVAKFQCFIRDNLTGLDLLAITVNGYLKPCE